MLMLLLQLQELLQKIYHFFLEFRMKKSMFQTSANWCVYESCTFRCDQLLNLFKQIWLLKKPLDSSFFCVDILTYRFSDIRINGTGINKDCFVANPILNNGLIGVGYNVVVGQHSNNKVCIFSYVCWTWADICSFGFKCFASWSRHIIDIQFVSLEKEKKNNNQINGKKYGEVLDEWISNNGKLSSSTFYNYNYIWSLKWTQQSLYR